MKEFKFEKIAWADALEFQDGWKTLEEAINWADNDDWITHQVGWVLKETDEYILFSDKHSNDRGEGRKYSGVFKIPKPWIVNREEL